MAKPYVTSRFPAMCRIQYPLIPSQPSGFLVDNTSFLKPKITIQLPADTRDIFGIIVQDKRTAAGGTTVTLSSDDAGDTRKMRVVGQDDKDQYVEETIKLNGTTPVTTTKSFTWILWVDAFFDTVLNETPRGVTDGLETFFSLSNPPIDGTVTVQLDGQQQIAGIDYNIVGGDITFANPPPDGAQILCSYLWQPITTSNVTIGGFGVLAAGTLQWLADPIIYRYEDLSFGGSADDPALTFVWDNILQEDGHKFYVYFYNLLDELSRTYEIPETLATSPPTGIFGNPGDTTTECLDVRLFGAKCDGFTDDTDAIQAAFDAAGANWRNAQQTVEIPGNVFGPTIVCIPSGCICCVYPRRYDLDKITDGTRAAGDNISGVTNEIPTPAGTILGDTPYRHFNLAHVPSSAPTLLLIDGVDQGAPNYALPDGDAGWNNAAAVLFINPPVNPHALIQISYSWDSGSTDANPPNWDGTYDSLIPSEVGFTCLQIDTGVTLKLDGVLMLGNDKTKAYDVWKAKYDDVGVFALAIFLIENRNSFVGGPWYSQSKFPTPDLLTFDANVTQLEQGPRDHDIRITGIGSMDCNGLREWNSGGKETTDRNYEVCAMRFCKADNLTIEKITVKNANTYTSNVIDISDCQHANVDGIVVDNIYNASNTFSSGGAIVMSAARLSSIQNCTVKRFGGVAIMLWACQRCQIGYNFITRGGWDGENIDFIAVYDWYYNLGWFLADELECNTNIVHNQIVFNHGRPWTVNTFYYKYNIASPTRSLITDPIMMQIGNETLDEGITDQTDEPQWPTTVTSAITDGGPDFLVWQDIGSELDMTDFQPVDVNTENVAINLYGNNGNGLRMNGMRVSENHINDNVAFGIRFRGLGNGQIQHNYISNNFGTGIHQDDGDGSPDEASDNLALEGNQASNNSDHFSSSPPPGAVYVSADLEIDNLGTHQYVNNPQIAGSPVYVDSVLQ